MNPTFEERHALHGLRIGIATLNAERSLNALDAPMAEALLDRLRQWADDPSIVCVLLRGSGQRAFCAGGDVRRLAAACLEHPGEVPAIAARFFTEEYRLVHCLRHFPKPLIAWGHGYVLGGGMGLLQSASIRIVTPGSRLAMPEISIGLYPDVAAGWFLPRLPGRLGLFLGLTGTQINARDALELGLADRFLRDDQQEELLDGLVQLNWTEQPGAQLNSLLQALTREATSLLPEAVLMPLKPRLDEILDVADLPAAWHALVALAQDQVPLLAQAGRNLASGCPLTAHLVWEQFRRARYLSLADILRMELAMSLNCCRYPEFAEGVRARLIDKDSRPRWHWADVRQIPEAVIQAHFQPAWSGAHPLAELVDQR